MAEPRRQRIPAVLTYRIINVQYSVINHNNKIIPEALSKIYTGTGNL